MKNKFGPPKMEGWLRICFRDGNNNPQGPDAAFDTFQMLKRTGRIESVREKGKKRAFKVKMEQVKGRVFDWLEFKLMILGSTDKALNKYAKVEFGGNLPNIRKELFNEIRNKRIYSMLQGKSNEDEIDEDLEE